MIIVWLCHVAQQSMVHAPKQASEECVLFGQKNARAAPTNGAENMIDRHRSGGHHYFYISAEAPISRQYETYWRQAQWPVSPALKGAMCTPH
jgi:hypothetical protein